jgi:hypothetical protein
LTRIVQNYAKVQQSILAADAAAGRVSRLSPSEIVQGVSGIDIVAQYDQYQCRVFVSTLDGGIVPLTVKVTP